MASVKDIISSIFRKFENEELSPEFIRDEANEVCDILEIQRVGDPGRTAREFAEKGYVSKYNGTCKYSPNAISQSLKNEFESYEYVYAHADYESKMRVHSQKKFEDLLVQLRKCIDDNPDRKSQIQKEILSAESLERLSLVFPLVDENEFTENKSEDEIIQKLAECLIKEHNEKNTAGYAYFGFKYGHLINKLGKVVEKIVRQAKLADSSIYDTAGTEIRHGLNTYNNVSKEGCVGKASVSEFEFNFAENNSLDVEDESLQKGFTSPSFTPSQIIYYGVPGSGKSNKIKESLKDVPDERKERVVFHPEYTHADFVGQILPVVHDGVDYKFTPGPFTKMVAKAYKSLASENPEQFYLVIEEINRGNAAAIFGDVFQLLDRIKPGESDSSLGNGSVYTEGWSQYFVYNEDINSKVLELAEAAELKMGSVTFTKDSGIRLPPNLSIYATMNTSDQNVFTLDNAFQRRWDMELVPNTCKWDDGDHKNQAQLPIGDTDIRWETFRKTVNNEISGGDFFNADDKQLGLFFIDADGDKIDEKKFANKVLKYLWADVFKRDTGKIFKSENLSKVVEDFTGTDAFDKVFVEDFVQSLKNTNDEIKNHE